MNRRLLACVATSALLGVLAATQMRAQSREDHFADDFCSEESSPILVLGTYHMANPGLDSYNVEADDVLSPRRQREIGELLDRLEQFAPTLIAVEAKYGRETWPDRYERYLAGDYELGRSEIEQIGFRLARRLGLANIEPVDFPMWMNGWRNDEIDWDKLAEQRAAQEAESDTAADEPPPPTEEQRRLLESSITEYLRWLNSPKEIRDGHAVYMRLLLPPEGIGMYSRTDQVRSWYERNLRIFTNLNRVTEHGKDRVLLIIGAGHLKILRTFAIDAPYYCLVDSEAYLSPGTSGR
jgi:hypothetical protein